MVNQGLKICNGDPPISINISGLRGDFRNAQQLPDQCGNIGRAKLAAGAVGLAKTALNDSIQYARQRMAFGKPIVEFGAIQHKLAEMAARTWAAEGMVYRTAGALDRALAAAGAGTSVEALRAVEEYAIECSIVKVFCSEVLDFVVDEAVQIHGGYGYSAEYAVERYYRDSRVNRIFEGTNEINRLVIVAMLLKRGASGRLPLNAWIEQATVSVRSGKDPFGPIDCARNAFLFTLGIAMEKHGDGLKDEQEIAMLLADAAMAIYAADTAVERVADLTEPDRDFTPELLFSVTLDRAVHTIERGMHEVLAALLGGKPLQEAMSAVTRTLAWMPDNTIQARRDIAKRLTM